VSAIGHDFASNLESLRHNVSGIAPVSYLKTQHKEFPVGEVKHSNEELAERVGCHDDMRHYRTALMGLTAAREAIKMACLSETDLGESAFINGTTVGGMDYTEAIFTEHYPSPTALTDRSLLHNDCGSSTELICNRIGKFQYISTISTACSSAANAIIYGANLIKAGIVKRAVVGGTESLSRFHFNGFNTLMILDREACRPFDDSRNGINLGEGAAYIVLESEDSSKERKCRPLAMLSGYGNACDAFHQTATSENGEGAYRAMSKALAMSGLGTSDIDYINCHGTGTPNNDFTELTAMRRIWGETLPPFSSTKGFTGHTTSASGSIEAIFCIFAIQNSFIPGNINTSHPIVGAENIVLENSTAEVRHAVCNAFGFGGNDSSLIISKAE
jgi:3-oxoacyl-[acyl-carrier-protein] synthase-1